MSKKPYYITTPIYYPSGNPHIGHCYTTVACDSIARFRRMQGYDVIFLTGTDEHGLKIEQKAAAKGITPKEYVDEVVKTFKALWEKMHVSYDRYIRTTDDYHVETVQKIFKRLYDLGYIYKGEYKGKYCTPCESFWTESQLDENGCCPECHREVTEAKEEAYFMKMAPFAERIEKLLLETDYLQPKTRAVELVNNFIKPGLEDLCVSRTSFTWGIPVTFDTKHVVYVWVDALSNYISALGYENSAYHDFDEYWPADVHMVAKDIMRFHAIIWPAMLMALDLPLPKHLAVHGWITFNGQKMSKSLGNVVDPFLLADRYGADAIRYHILREMALGADSSFSNEIMINRINSDLANGLGNLVSRTVAMVDKSRKQMHDFKNHITTLEYLHQGKENTKAVSYMQELQQQMKEQMNLASFKVKNAAFDVILYEQNKRCQELGITFEKQVLYDDLSFLSYMDTCTIFANALDNAVKACSEIKEGERKIELFLKRKKDMLNIVIKNTKQNQILESNNRFFTTKSNKEHHGFGIENIKMAVEKYHGLVSIEYTEDSFVLAVIIPIPV